MFTLLGQPDAVLVEGERADFYVDVSDTPVVDDATATREALSLQDVKAGGVGAYLVTSLESDGVLFAFEGGSPDDGGFGVGAFVGASSGAARVLSPEVLAIIGTVDYQARVDQPFSAFITATGGRGAYTFTGTSLPDVLTINAVTGEISGTPTAQGRVSGIVVTVTDEDLDTADSALFSIDVVLRYTESFEFAGSWDGTAADANPTPEFTTASFEESFDTGWDGT